MSLFSLLSTAVAVPFIVVLAAFLLFLIWAQIAGRNKTKTSEVKQNKSVTKHVNRPIVNNRIVNNRPAMSSTTVAAVSISSNMAIHERAEATYVSEFSPAYATNDTLSYQLLSTYLGDSTLNGEAINNYGTNLSTLIPGASTIEFEITDIPGINSAMEKELIDLGYSSIEQIARWGRADVRAVSATLGIDQQKIEDEWIAGARLILSIR